MSKNELWNEFEKSGKIEDYLKYKLNEENVEIEDANETVESQRSSN